MKYKGIYRVKAHVDQATNDFPRNMNGIIETDDLYILCAHNCQIYHYGKSILVAYIPSIMKGHNVLKELGTRLCGLKFDKGFKDYDGLYEALYKEGTIKHIMENDEEIEFRFHSKSIDLIAELLNAKTFGAGISPFSTRNLPKASYTIPDEEIAAYKKITSKVRREDSLAIKNITNDFIQNTIAKSNVYRSKDIKKEIRKLMLKNKDFIHYTGYWDRYIDYLQNELQNRGIICKE